MTGRECNGLGLRGDIRRNTTAQISAKIDRLLTDPRFKTSVDEMRQKYLAYSPDRALEVVELT